MFLDRFEVIDEEKIQQGGQAKVFACIDTETEDRVAVKTTKLENPQLVQSYQREVKALSRLDNSGVIQILDHDIEMILGLSSCRGLKTISKSTFSQIIKLPP